MPFFLWLNVVCFLTVCVCLWTDVDGVWKVCVLVWTDVVCLWTNCVCLWSNVDGLWMVCVRLWTNIVCFWKTYFWAWTNVDDFWIVSVCFWTNVVCIWNLFNCFWKIFNLFQPACVRRHLYVGRVKLQCIGKPLIICLARRRVVFPRTKVKHICRLLNRYSFYSGGIQGEQHHLNKNVARNL